MSQMKNMAVLRCSQCGGAVVLTHLSTTESDPDSEILLNLMRNIGKNVMCPACLERLNRSVELERKGIRTDFHVRPAIS